MFKSSRIFASAFVIGLVGCAAPGTSPQDMSAAQHEAMAKQEDTAADGNAVGRIPFTAATVPARPVDESVYDGATVAPESNVSAKAPEFVF